MNYDIFISYSRKDTAVADRICDAFDRVGISYFIDRQGVGGGFEFPVVLAEAIVASKVVLFLASVNSYESKFTNAELTFAFNEKPKNTILPYIIDGSTMPPALRFIFSSINWRTIESHPIETTLMDDILKMLGRDALSRKVKRPSADDAAQNMQVTQLYGLGRGALDRKEYTKAVEYYRKAADMGYVKAYHDLGYCYANGLGVERDVVEAFKLYRIAAELGSEYAQYAVGFCYANADGVERDYAEAVKWYRRAAEQGLAVAEYALGYSYTNGQGVVKDAVAAKEWFRKSARNGCDIAKKYLDLIGESY